MKCNAKQYLKLWPTLKKNKIKSAFPEIMIPLVSTEAEIKIMKELVIRTASQVQQENKLKIEFLVGTMIELPRAAIKAKEIAKHAEFFSFGTNDLTQTTFGISRDDSGKFLNDYLENKIFTADPFVSIDEGVADLFEIQAKNNPKLLAVQDVDGKKYLYRQTLNRVLKISKIFINKGVKPKDRIAIISENRKNI